MKTPVLVHPVSIPRTPSAAGKAPLELWAGSRVGLLLNQKLFDKRELLSMIQEAQGVRKRNGLD